MVCCRPWIIIRLDENGPNIHPILIGFIESVNEWVAVEAGAAFIEFPKQGRKYSRNKVGNKVGL